MQRAGGKGERHRGAEREAGRRLTDGDERIVQEEPGLDAANSASTADGGGKT